MGAPMRMSILPQLSAPASERPLNLRLSYVKRETAIRQADAWNAHLQDHPELGPSSGYVVGVGSRRGGRYPLVWVGR